MVALLAARTLLRAGGCQPLARAALCVRPKLTEPVRRLCTKSAPPPSGWLEHITQQIRSEIAGSTKNRTTALGFYGALCNWFLGISAVYDASSKGPEVISLKMTGVMMCYSTLFATWAGWAVMPRNFILAGSHLFNILAQSNQLRRCLEHKVATEGDTARQEVADLATKAAVAGAAVAAYVFAAPTLRRAVAPYGPAYVSGPAGPFTIHPWPPVSKLAISGASLIELDRPTDKISLSQVPRLRRLRLARGAVCQSRDHPHVPSHSLNRPRARRRSTPR